MAFVKRSVPEQIDILQICEQCKKPKEICICSRKEQTDVRKKSDSNRKLLHRKSN